MTFAIAKTSVVIPAKNEANGLRTLIPSIQEMYPELLEIIVVDDGSDDETQAVCEEFRVRVVRHVYSRGNGAAIKSGVRKAKGEYLCFMDADGQHKAESIGSLLKELQAGFDMVIGARKSTSQADTGRLLANTFYNKLASAITNFPIKDLTSGLRVAKAKKFKKFLYLLPNGFSYPTTITMAFLRVGYQVSYSYQEINPERIGKSHISPIKDGLRFLIIIFKIGTLYSPLKVFTPISALLFFIALSYYMFTFFSIGQLTNMTVILFTSSMIIFLIGLVSEQINALMFMQEED